MNKEQFELATVAKGKEILITGDDFIKNLSRAEYSLRMGTDREVNKKEFLAFLQSSVIPWEEEEKQRLLQVQESVKDKLKSLKIGISTPIFLIKTNGEEEWNSAYTRTGAIILPQKKVSRYNNSRLESLLIHEVFHIISKSFPGLRNILYGLIGFEKINDICLPEGLKSRLLTNPDYPYLNYYTTVLYGKKKVAVMPVTLIKEGKNNIYSRRDILESISASLLVLRKRGLEFEIIQEEDGPVLLDFKDILGFEEKTGFSKDDFYSPEESLADVFTQIINGNEINNRKLLRGLKKVLV